MGEEEKKAEDPKAEEKKAEEPKKAEEKKKEEETKTEEVQKDEKKKAEESKEEVVVAAPPPQEIILRIYMHCEGCARKVRRCLKGFEGVEEVTTDCKSHKVVVKGEKADPRKVVARVQRKSHRQVELISPIPPPLPPEDPLKPPQIEIHKPQEKKKEAQVITVVLKVYMHCEACAQEIKKRIRRMKGVESAEPDLKASEVMVKGVFEASELVEYVYKRTGKHAVVVKQDPEPQKKEEGKPKDKKKSGEGGDKKDEAKGGDTVAEGGGAGDDKKEGGGGGGGGGEEAVKLEGVTADQLETNVLELKKNDFYYYDALNYQIYPPQPATEMYSYSYGPPAPQMFSDENPNACSIM